MAMVDMIVSGYISVDRIIRIGAPAKVGVTSLVQNHDNGKAYFGGNASNIAACAAKLGCSAMPIGRVGSDFRPMGFYDFLASAGADLSQVTTIANEVTCVGYLIEDAEKNHLTLAYPGAMHEKYAVRRWPDPLFTQAKLGVLTVGTYPDTVQFLEKVRKTGLPLVFSMRADFSCFPKPILWEVLMESAIIFTNEVERQIVEELYGIDSITHFMKEGKASIVVTTLGKAGSVVYWKEQGAIKSETVPVTPSGEVVDATGAGDSYIAGFLYGYLKGADPVTCAAYGSTESSFIIEKVGCLSNVPTEAEMLLRHQTR